MARKTVLDAVRIAARRLFRAPALDRTLSSAGEAFFQLDSALSPVPDRVSFSSAVRLSAGKGQAGEEAISFDAQQRAAESAVRGEIPFSAAGMEERAAFLRKTPGLTETGGDRTAAEAVAAVWAEEQTERQRTGMGFWRSAAQTAVENLGDPAVQAVKSISRRDGSRAEMAETAKLLEAIRSAAALQTRTQTPAAREANHAPIVWKADAEIGSTFRETGTLLSTMVPRSVENIISGKNQAVEEAVRTAAALTPRREQNAAVFARDRNPAVSSAQSVFENISTAGTNNAAIPQMAGATADEIAAVWKTIRTGKAGIMQAEGRAERSSAFSTGMLSLVENSPVFSSTRTAQQEAAGSERIGLPLPQPAGEETLSSVPRPVRETASVSTSGEQTARSSPAVRRKEAAPTSEEFWNQWARRFAGELHSSPEGVHG